MASKQRTNAAADQPKSPEEFDPKFEWQENATNYVIRIYVSGFKKEDFRVQVDSTGKLIVRGQRPAGADGKYTRFHKVFQMPDGVNLEGISGRFEANVLSLTLPKNKKRDGEAEETKGSQQEQDQQPKPAEEKKEEKPKAKTTPSKKAREDGVKPKADERKVEDGNKGGERVVEESLADMVRRRVQEESAKAAAEAEREKKEQSGWRGRKAELEGFPEMEWADGLVDMVRKNREVIATAAAAAAISLGLFVAHKLFSRK